MEDQKEHESISNFAPGPGRMPVEVLAEVQRELISYQGSGISPLELSHRTPLFDSWLKQAEQNLRDLFVIPDNYKVLFMIGGGCGQFDAVPMNLLPEGKSADYIVTGYWSAKAAREAGKHGDINIVCRPEKFTTIPDTSEWKTNDDAAYLYYCDNETIEGVEFQGIPESKVPIVCDMSSSLLSRPVDVSKYGLIFAGSHKNAGCPGLTFVIIREDLIGNARSYCPSVINYKVLNDSKCLYNTPPVFNIYLTNIMSRWINSNGGLEGMYEANVKKAAIIYSIIDQSKVYYCPVDKSCRSKINIVFRIGSKDGDEDIQDKFVAESEKKGLFFLRGHKVYGGIRATLYNAVSMKDTQLLAEFMKNFEISL